MKPGGRYHGKAGDYAMHKFAYYICFKCQQPYFGGQRSCEVAGGVGEERAFIREEMICGGCSSMGQVCQLPSVTIRDYQLQALTVKEEMMCGGRSSMGQVWSASIRHYPLLSVTSTYQV